MNETVGEKPTLYLETTIPSYLTAWPMRDVVLLAQQQLTREWWENHCGRFQVFVSELVLEEAAAGDSDAARRRFEMLAGMPLLQSTSGAERLAMLYLREIPLPSKAARDAAHIAIASVHAMDYLVTWNCRHIAHGEVRRAVENQPARGATRADDLHASGVDGRSAMNDPIVEEVRAAGTRLFEASGNDLHKFFEILRRNERSRGVALVNRSTEPSAGATVSSRETATADV